MFRRPLVITENGSDAGPTLAAVARLAPSPDGVRLLTLGDLAPAPESDPGHAELEGARLAALNAGAVALAVHQEGADLLVVPPLATHSALERAEVILRIAVRYGVPVLSVGGGAGRAPAVAGREGSLRVAIALDGPLPVPPLAPFLERVDPGTEIVLLAVRATPARCDELRKGLEVFLPGRQIRSVPVPAVLGGLAEAVDGAAMAENADVVVIASDGLSDMRAFAVGLFSASALQRAQCPVLLLPRTHATTAAFTDTLVASDSLALPHADSLLAIERSGLLGTAVVAPAEQVLVSVQGEPRPPLSHDMGVVALPHDWLSDWLGRGGDEVQVTLYLQNLQGAAGIRVIRPARPLVLVDASAAPEIQPRPEVSFPDAQVIFVRLRNDEPLRGLREALGHRAGGGAPVLIDASAWLDDAGADDVPRAVDAQRLLRLGLRLTALGAHVHGVIGRDPLHPEAFVFSRIEAPATDTEPGHDVLSRELELFSGSRPREGQEISFELDNGRARAQVLELIGTARERIHLQTYIVEDDPVAAQFEHALADAARRGVLVRILVDAVYSRHEAFGARNPVLTRLEAVPGVEVRAYHPVSGLPDIAALKQRNHRKFIVLDNQVAVITGRNIGAPYFTGFDEVQLTPLTPYRVVPWMDCGAVMRGPLVASVERAFRREWTLAGGDGFEIRECAPAGSLRARLVLHEGLVDTRTLDTQLALIRHAKRELLIVNTFPLVIELQRALVAALKRGVRVRVLFGNVRPRFLQDTPFPGGAFRNLADQIVRSRLDAVVAAGGEANELALPVLPGWDPVLTRVFPHVHAKVLIRDGEDTALGSANLDVTAAYWESEAMLLVHDAGFARALTEALDAVIALSRRVVPNDPLWQSGAAQRAWLGRVWPSVAS